MVELNKLSSAVAVTMRLGKGVQPSITNMNTFGSLGIQPQSR